MDKNGTASELVLHDVHLLVSKLDALPNGRFLLTGSAGSAPYARFSGFQCSDLRP